MTEVAAGLSQASAEAIIESLRSGIPPTGHLRSFTVGRSHEIAQLEQTLGHGAADRGAALLVQANYGAGKTHLLRLLRELAFDAGYAVALVTVDSQGGVRFNRMDQVAAAVMRSVELDGNTASGIWNVFEAFGAIDPGSLSVEGQDTYERITARGRWDLSMELRSPGVYVALRTWVNVLRPSVRDVIIGWLSHPWEYKTARRRLYDELILALPVGLRDPRPDSAFYRDGVFVFDAGGHQQAWSVLADLDKLVRLCGRRGLVLLFDEFEDVIQNLNNIGWQQDAFYNLFRLFIGEDFPGLSYFAVTPEFVYKCQERLYDRQVYYFPVERFAELKRLEMTPIGPRDFTELAHRIRAVHGTAYGWDADDEYTDDEIDDEVTVLFTSQSTDQVRQAVEGLVGALDERLDG